MSQSRTPQVASPHPEESAGPDLPGWPVLIVFGLFPVWWLLGVVPVVALAMAIPMAMALIQARGVLIVPGVLPWLAFSAWCLASAVMIDSPDRLMGYALRVGQILAAAVALVYVVNSRRGVTTPRLVRALLVVWVSAIIGGYLGMRFPGVRLPTAAGSLLPQRLAANDFVQDLFRPALSQVQRPSGGPAIFVRPSAPFAYANSWGGAMVLLTLAAGSGFALARSWLVRLLILLGVCASVPPALATQNRGMILTLLLGLGYIGIRLAVRGRPATLVVMICVTAAVSVGAVWGGLAQPIVERQLQGNTTEGRAKLYIETIERTLASPVIGWGAPRPSLSSEISVGTQGHLWFVMFSFGFVGLMLFLVFLWGAALRTWRARGTPTLWLHAILVAAGLMIAFYGLDATTLMIVICVAGVLLRERYLPAGDG